MYVTYCSWLCMRGSRWCAKIGQIDRAFSALVFVHHARLRPPIIKFHFLAKFISRDIVGIQHFTLSDGTFPGKFFTRNYAVMILRPIYLTRLPHQINSFNLINAQSVFFFFSCRGHNARKIYKFIKQ